MQGVGEVLTPLPALPPLAPGAGQSRHRGAHPGDLRAGLGSRTIRPCRPFQPLPDVDALLGWLGSHPERLQAPAIARVAPVIADVLRALEGQGAGLARMSGSGATCFGIFADPADAAERAAADPCAQSAGGAVATELASGPARG